MQEPASTTHVHIIDIETAATILVSLNLLEEAINDMQTQWIRGNCLDHALKCRILTWIARAKKARQILAEYDVEQLVKCASTVTPISNFY